MGAHVPSASRTAIGVAAANRKEPRRDGYLRKPFGKITREFYGFRENRDFLELIPLCSSSLATKARFAVSDFLSDVGKVKPS